MLLFKSTALNRFKNSEDKEMSDYKEEHSPQTLILGKIDKLLHLSQLLQFQINELVGRIENLEEHVTNLGNTNDSLTQLTEALKNANSVYPLEIADTPYEFKLEENEASPISSDKNENKDKKIERKDDGSGFDGFGG